MEEAFLGRLGLALAEKGLGGVFSIRFRTSSRFSDSDFSMPINPAMHRFPKEAAIIGRMIVAFGELEFMAGVCAGYAVGDRELILKALFTLRNSSSRLDLVEVLAKPGYTDVQLSDELAEALGAIRFCLKIRNQYAHCHWADHSEAGLFFANLEAAAKRATFDSDWLHIDLSILEAQEAYFDHAMRWMGYLEHELLARRGKLKCHAFPKPQALHPPILHNLRSQHLPPWLGEDQMRLHIERARVAEGGDRSQKQKSKGPPRKKRS